MNSAGVNFMIGRNATNKDNNYTILQWKHKMYEKLLVIKLFLSGSANGLKLRRIGIIQKEK